MAKESTEALKGAVSIKPPVPSQNGLKVTSKPGEDKETLLQILTSILGRLQEAGQQFQLVPLGDDATGICLLDVEFTEDGQLAPVNSQRAED